jgi:hypothetical protein
MIPFEIFVGSFAQSLVFWALNEGGGKFVYFKEWTVSLVFKNKYCQHLKHIIYRFNQIL